MDHIYTTNQPGLHELLAEIRRTTDAFDGTVLIGEFEYSTPLPALASHYGTEAHPIIHLPFNFNLIGMPWNASTVRTFVERYEEALPDYAQPNYVLGNHDKPRIATHVGDGQARVAMMALLTLRGTPFIYYGDEIGMTNVPDPGRACAGSVAQTLPELSRDPVADADAVGLLADGRILRPAEYAVAAGGRRRRRVTSRTSARTTVRCLRLTRELLHLRRDYEPLAAGVYRTIPSESDHAFVFEREHAGGRAVVALNFGAASVDVPVPGAGVVAVSTRMDRRDERCGSTIRLRAEEGCVILIDDAVRRRV